MDSTTLAAAGTYPSLCWDTRLNRWLAAWQSGSVITTNYPEVPAVDVKGSQTSFPRLYAFGGAVWLTARDGTEQGLSRLYQMDGFEFKVRRELGPGHGMYPTVMGNGLVAWQVAGSSQGWPIDSVPLVGMDPPLPAGLGAPTGLALINSAGVIMNWDQMRGAVPGLADPTFAGFLCVGATDRDGQPCCVVMDTRDGRELELWKGMDSLNPVIAWDGGDKYAVTAWSAMGWGIRLAEFNINELVVPNHEDEWPADGPNVATGLTRWSTWFYSRGRYGDFMPAQNACLLSADWYSDNGAVPPDAHDRVAAGVNAEGAGFIGVPDISFAKSYWKKVVAVFVHEAGNPDQVRAAVANAQAIMDTFGLPRRPVVAIITPTEAHDPAYAGTADALAPEIYLDTPADSWDSTHQKAVDFVAKCLETFPKTPLFLIPQAYDRNDPQWKDHPSHLSAIAQACFDALPISRVKGLWPFAYARPGGATTYPQLEDWYSAQAEALTTPALPVDPEEPVDPEDDMTPEQVAAFMRANPVPSDINTEAYLDFRSKVWLRDQIAEPNGTPIITRGALTIYYDPYFNSEVAAQLSQFGAPSGPPDQYAATWRRYAAAGVSRAVNVYKHGDPARGLAGQPPGPEDPQ